MHKSVAQVCCFFCSSNTIIPTVVKSNALPTEISELFNKNNVSTGYHMSLDNNSSFIFSYKPKSGDGSRVTSKNILDDLKAWLYAKDSAGDYARFFQALRLPWIRE